jgi:hypothetical protein
MRKQTERTSQVFYTAPATIARILCLLLFFSMAATYAVLFFLMPATEALALLPPLFPLFAWGILGEVALAFLISRLSPIRIDGSGITLTTIWGAKQTLLWDEIKSATPGKCLFVSYLKVSPSPESRRTPLIIPMTVTRPSAFADSMRHHVPQGNPVQQFLDSK